MSVVIFTAAELAVLTGMLGGLIRKRAHDRQRLTPAVVRTHR